MTGSRPSTPEAPPQDLWSSIYSKPVSDESKEESRTDFALGYDWADVKDGEEGYTLARLSVYIRVLPHFLPPRNVLPHTAVMIVLDWTRPWTFMEELEMWLKWVEQWAKGDGSREVEIVREENRERLQVHLQHYTEPSTDTLPATSNLTSSTVLPLGPGTFTHNSAGVPIAVVCTKADLIDEGSNLIGPGTSGMGGMVKGKGGEWEERTDSIMQVLRTICLKYGAALFYTTPQPSTLQVIRQYTLHLLFIPPAPSPGVSAGTEAPASIRNPFCFHHKPNTLGPRPDCSSAGWDSWGKITVLREGFEAKSWGEAWDTDIEASEGEAEGGKRCKADVPDLGTGPSGKKASLIITSQSQCLSQPFKPPPLPPFNAPMADKAFLAKHYDENCQKPDRDPRGAFRNPAESATAGYCWTYGKQQLSAFQSVTGGTRPTSGLSSVGVPGASTAGRTSTSPTLGASTNATGGQTQHESLLSSKDRAGQSAAASRTAATQPPKTNGKCRRYELI
ncbi:dynein light intermediate chain-domain-containing protein [Pisolithus marmoratus]|nr:dynein light intermediate chain-domain-containing protein [Pisolithus marmoratus]